MPSMFDMSHMSMDNKKTLRLPTQARQLAAVGGSGLCNMIWQRLSCNSLISWLSALLDMTDHPCSLHVNGSPTSRSAQSFCFFAWIETGGDPLQAINCLQLQCQTRGASAASKHQNAKMQTMQLLALGWFAFYILTWS